MQKVMLNVRQYSIVHPLAVAVAVAGAPAHLSY